MQKRFLFSAVAIALLLGGCGDKKEASKEKNAQAGEIATPQKHEETSAVVKVSPAEVEVPAKEVAPAVVSEKKVDEHLDAKVVKPLLKAQETAKVSLSEKKQTGKVNEDEKNHKRKEERLDPAIEVAKSVASVEIAQSVASVDIARALASTDVNEAVVSVETLELENKESAHGKENQLQSAKERAAHTITHVVKEVEAAKAASAATIATSVKKVEAARAASSVSDPAPARNLEVAKASSSGEIARSVASVEIAKAKAASDMAKTVAKVEMNKRLYGENSPEVATIKAVATGEMAKAVGGVKIAQADALADISKSVATVEIAKIEAGVASGTIAHGQKLYLQKLKRACGMNGAEFAKKHTQDVWKTLKDVGYFGTEVVKICPNLKAFKDVWEKSLFDFVYEYASDSGHVPSCD